MENNLKTLVDVYVSESTAACKLLSQQGVFNLVKDCIESFENSKQIFLVGNGGTAGILSNFYSDILIHPFVGDDKSNQIGANLRLKAHNLCDVSALTALSNDLGFDQAFSFYLKQMGDEGDLLIAVSGSGTSKNIVNALRTAKNTGMRTCLITKNNKSVENADTLIVLSSDSEFPGQTGKNNFNFHFEDLVCKLSHIVSGILKLKVNEKLSTNNQ
jgi:D-sedoheptulose 7-phosphate isomerase